MDYASLCMEIAIVFVLIIFPAVCVESLASIIKVKLMSVKNQIDKPEYIGKPAIAVYCLALIFMLLGLLVMILNNKMWFLGVLMLIVLTSIFVFILTINPSSISKIEKRWSWPFPVPYYELTSNNAATQFILNIFTVGPSILMFVAGIAVVIGVVAVALNK